MALMNAAEEKTAPILSARHLLGVGDLSVSDISALLDLADKANKRPAELSGGDLVLQNPRRREGLTELGVQIFSDGEPDVETELYAVSVKSRAAIPKHIEEAVRDAFIKAERAGKWPLVVLDYSGRGHKNLVLFCHPGAAEWESIHGR